MELRRDTISCNSLLNACDKSQQWMLSLHVLETMRTEGIQQDAPASDGSHSQECIFTQLLFYACICCLFTFLGEAPRRRRGSGKVLYKIGRRRPLRMADLVPRCSRKLNLLGGHPCSSKVQQVQLPTPGMTMATPGQSRHSNGGGLPLKSFS